MPRFQAKQVRLYVILASLLFVFIFNAWFLQFNFQNVSEQERWVTHTGEVLAEVNATLSSLKDVETSVRGFLLTGKDPYLELYHSGRDESQQHLNRAKFLTKDNESHQDTIQLVDQKLQQRFVQLDNLIRDFRHDGRVSREAPAFSDGKMTMESLRNLLEAMKAEELTLLAQRTDRAERSRVFFVWALVLTTVLSIVVLCIAFIQISHAQKKIAKQSQHDAIEAYEKSRIAQLAQDLSVADSLEMAGKVTLSFLKKQVGALAGKVFMLSHGQLKVIASVGHDDTQSNYDKKIQASLVNTAFKSENILQVKDVPAQYWKISSGLGEAVPAALILLPFSFQGQRLGVVELGAFGSLQQDQLNFLSRFSEIIGIGLNAIQNRESLQGLLEQTQQQAEELQAQQEELRVNNEELEQQTRALESQQQALNLKNKELEDTRRELEVKAHHLERSSQYKSEFLAKMSHELRTPLNGLLILSTLLVENKEKNLTEQQKQFARTIHSAGNDLLALINDILDLSKIEARKLVLRPESFTLGELIEGQAAVFKPQASAKQLKFSVELPSNLTDLILHTDRQRLEQILRNFLSNAVKFTEKGEVKLGVEFDKAQEKVVFSVQDTGIGIAESKQKAIFESFEQADSSISRKYGGTGLGLTISRELSVLLQGKITVSSQPEKGSRFTLEVPLKFNSTAQEDSSSRKSEPLPMNVAPALVTPKMSEHPEWVRADVQKALSSLQPGKKTILIVEDDANFRAAIVDVIKSYDFEAIEAASGEVALGILNDRTPDAVLLDIKLPGISGLGILEMIKQIPRLRHIPVHMISALEYQQNALRMGAFGYLTKPVTIEKVRSAMDRIEKLISTKLRRVLLIEDDQSQSEAVRQLISGQDLEVVPVKTGREAILELKKGEIDCVVLDLSLPDISGVDLLSELRSLEISLPPIVVYTGKDLSIEEEDYLKKYSESIIIKGARSPERLLDEVNLFLHRVESLLPEEKQMMLSSLRSKALTFEGRTVLLVDDDIRNIFSLMSALEARGLQVHVARNGVEALEALDQNKEIDLVLMDIMMPKMDGFEAMRRIRKHSDVKIREIPIVALTAKAMREDHERCMEAGANDYLPKPVNLENLTTVMRIWLPSKGFLE